MRRRDLLLASAALLVAACATQPSKGRRDLFAFLQDGRSTRDIVYLQLGAPAREFESGRIASWRIGEDETGYFLVPSSASGWRGVRYELVVVFATDNIVQRHSIVEIRPP
jgi:hypothetical protein